MSELEIVGPFTSHWVVVDGRQVPFLEAEPANGGIIRLTLDQRYALDVPVADADRIISFIADCIAVGLGYTCHPRHGMEPVRSTPFPPATCVDLLGAAGDGSPARS
ncbi:MAG: hypothetical protein ACRDOU_17270 [Streptosporangiaceae bacterium]